LDALSFNIARGCVAGIDGVADGGVVHACGVDTTGIDRAVVVIVARCKGCRCTTRLPIAVANPAYVEKAASKSGDGGRQFNIRVGSVAFAIEEV